MSKIFRASSSPKPDIARLSNELFEYLCVKLPTPSASPTLPGGHLPFSPNTKRVIEEAAFQSGHDWIGTEHILLGILGANARDTIATKVLENLGLKLAEVRDMVREVLGGPETCPEVQPRWKDGGQAFPNGTMPGMTLRDYFAAQAMRAVAPLFYAPPMKNTEFAERLSEAAYKVAEAMLAERLKDSPVDLP